MDELLQLTRENNIMLKQIIAYINIRNNPNIVFQDDMKDFIMNCIANKISNNNRNF